MLHQFRVELTSGTPAKFFVGLFIAAGLAIGPIGNHRVEGIRNIENSGPQRDVPALRQVRIICKTAVVPEAVAAHDVDQFGREKRRGDHVHAAPLVITHDEPFFFRERPRFEQNGIGHAELADVMQLAGDLEYGAVVDGHQPLGGRHT